MVLYVCCRGRDIPIFGGYMCTDMIIIWLKYATMFRPRNIIKILVIMRPRVIFCMKIHTEVFQCTPCVLPRTGYPHFQRIHVHRHGHRIAEICNHVQTTDHGQNPSYHET